MKKSIQVTVQVSVLLSSIFLLPTAAVAGKSDLRAMLPFISEVRDQKGRNTCTIQTTVAMLESYYIKTQGSEIDLSEQWVQYLASIANRSGGALGSTVATDVKNALAVGVPQEQTLPYTSGEWKGSEAGAQTMCGHLAKGDKLTHTRCLYGKYPASYLKTSDQLLATLPQGAQFAEARAEALEIKALLRGVNPQLLTPNQAKAALNSKKPVALEINLYHGAWNTALAADKGMGRDKKLYKSGIVTYPEVGSVDRSVSPGVGSRHAVQIVGYDDDIEVTYKINMADGSTKTFKRKGVYIFKNSWGTKDFGRDFTYDKMRIKGFGMILQDYVHEFGKLTVFE